MSHNGTLFTKTIMKTSYYNIVLQYSDYLILYNSLSNSIVCFTQEEFQEIKKLLEQLDDFKTIYPRLFKKMEEAGFIVGENVDELDYIKLKNKLSTFEESRCHLTINPTLDCNLKCWYCSTEFKQALHQGAMKPEIIEAVKKHIEYLILSKRISHLHLDWFGGEPLLYFYEIIKPIATCALELCRNNQVKFTHHITTNSTLMNEDMMRDFNNLRLNSFQIPLDGNEKHHNSIKFNSDKSGTFAAIIKNLNSLPQIIPDAKITLRINYDRKTLYGIEDIIPLIADDAKKHITVDFQKVWQIVCEENDYEQLKRIKKIFIDNGLNSGFWAYQPGIFNRCYSDKFHHYAINYDGKVFKCTAQDYGKDKVIGVIQENGLISWNMERLSKLFAHSTFDNEKCLKCKSLPICMGPCITKNYEARKYDRPIPCVFENAEFALDSYIIEQAHKRGLIKQ